MATLKYSDKGLGEITIDPRDSLSVIAAPLEGPIDECTTGIRLHSHKILGIDGLLLFPRATATWEITVYRDQVGKFLFVVSGERAEEEIRVLTSGPDEEKSETVLEKVCTLSSFG